MPSLRAFSLALLAALPVAVLAAPAGAQKLARKAFEDQAHGYQFKPPEDFNPVPPQPQEEALGLVIKMSGKEVIVRKGADSIRVDVDGSVLRFAERVVREKAAEGETAAESKVRDDVAGYLEAMYKALDKDKPLVDEQRKINKLAARHRTWGAQTAQMGIPLTIDAWSFSLPDADVHLLFVVPQEHEKKWIKVFEKSAESFMLIDRSEASAALSKTATYDELLAYHKADAEKIPGWTALSTPSQKFILKTSSDNKKLLNDVITRLEKSRLLYEEDFPPTKDFKHVSIVRVCSNEEEFHKYGGTGGGVAGWFNPYTTELVLYNTKDVDPNMTYAVMSHEAFHQYCYFLFDQSEAHRWFDEGHGDYYGGVDFKGSKAVVTPHMPSGLDRYGEIKDMVKAKTYAPLAQHLNFSHQEWQNQGPSNVSCYAQSWSIIYMLRQGTLGKVPSKVWRPEYAEIIPHYVETLNAGFHAAFDEIRAARLAAAQAEGRELTDEEKQVNRFDLVDPSIKEKIWKQAMDASWGKIDLDQFEANWLAFVEDVL